METRVLAVTAALALSAVGCQGDEPHLTREDAVRAQEEARLRLHWLGEAFEGLPLTHAEGGLLVYGECKGEGSGDTFHCTGPQVQLQHWPLQRRHPRMFDFTGSEGCGRGRLGGRIVAAFQTSGGLEVYAGEVVVVIFASSRGESDRIVHAARALRPLSGGKDRVPPRSVAKALRRCHLGLTDALLGS